jgi:adenylyltransferase/sulfurtransferase
MTGADFTEDQIQRYARHIVLPQVGGSGQQRLLTASVLVVGAGGLGSPLVLYLAAAGVGRIGIVDDDSVDLSNLQRQIAHGTADLGTPKAASAAAAARRINPTITLEPHEQRFDSVNAAGLVAEYDMIADGSDNFATRFLVNDACVLAAKPLVSAALLRFEAQLSTWKGYAAEHPCYRCLFPGPPPPGTVPTCAEGGVFGALAGQAGSFQAIEVIKEILGIGTSLAGWLVLIDALDGESRKVRVRPDPDCPVCGTRPTITDLTVHAAD